VYTCKYARVCDLCVCIRGWQKGGRGVYVCAKKLEKRKERACHGGKAVEKQEKKEISCCSFVLFCFVLFVEEGGAGRVCECASKGRGHNTRAAPPSAPRLVCASFEQRPTKAPKRGLRARLTHVSVQRKKERKLMLCVCGVSDKNIGGTAES
jgi:hypothetical protein